MACVLCIILCFLLFFFFKQKTAYEMRISDWSSDVCSSDLIIRAGPGPWHWLLLSSRWWCVLPITCCRWFPTPCERLPQPWAAPSGVSSCLFATGRHGGGSSLECCWPLPGLWEKPRLCCLARESEGKRVNCSHKCVSRTKSPT